MSNFEIFNLPLRVKYATAFFFFFCSFLWSSFFLILPKTKLKEADGCSCWQSADFRSSLRESYRKNVINSKENADYLEEIRKKFIINYGGSITNSLFPDLGGLFVSPKGLGESQQAVEELSRLLVFEETDFELRTPFYVVSGFFLPYITLTIMLLEHYSLFGNREEILRLYDPKLLKENKLKREWLIGEYYSAKKTSDHLLIASTAFACIRLFKFVL